MKTALLLVASAMMVQANSCDTANVSAASKPTAVPTPYQRFVPVNAPSGRMIGVPWAGFFALDTKTGQLCATTTQTLGGDFVDVPMCSVLRSSFPDADPATMRPEER
jgi:hypothetical protein